MCRWENLRILVQKFNKQRGWRENFSPHPFITTNTLLRVQTLSGKFPTLRWFDPTFPVLCYTKWETQRKGHQLKRRTCCSLEKPRILNSSEQWHTTPLRKRICNGCWSWQIVVQSIVKVYHNIVSTRTTVIHRWYHRDLQDHIGWE